MKIIKKCLKMDTVLLVHKKKLFCGNGLITQSGREKIPSHVVFEGGRKMCFFNLN